MNDEVNSIDESGRSGWFKSSYSNALGNCVEVNCDGEQVLIRDSKDKRADAPIMSIGQAGWTAFLRVAAARPLGEPGSGSSC